MTPPSLGNLQGPRISPGLLATADTGYTTVLRRRPVPLTDGPPDDDYIVSLNIASLKSTRLYIDQVYRKIAELATFLAGSDLPKSPLGWVRLQTLQSYDGRDVPGNFNPTTQNVIATNKFSVLSHGNLRPMSKDVLETLLTLDFQARGRGRRFQYATYSPPAPDGGRTIKEYAVRLAPATQAAAGPEGPAPPAALVPPQYGAYFCSDSMLGIEPPVELLTILHGMHASWSLPEDILSFKYLLAQFPTLIVFTNDNVTQLSSLSLYPPWESSFYPISLTIPSLLPLLYSLFEPSDDAPMWGSSSLPTFSGSYPFQVHLQLWLFVHSSFLEHYGFPATPFIFINCTSSVETITEPDLFICAKDSPPTVELLLQTKCPHFFMHDHHTDQTAPHYGLVIATPASMYSDIMVSDLSPQFIPYP